MRNEFSRIFYAILGILLLFSIGTLGYMWIENYVFLDALYMSVITLATVGFSEVAPLSPNGRVFTIFLIFGGVTLFLYFIGVLTTLLAEGEFLNYMRRVRMKKRIANLKNHYIIVGYGRTGSKLIENFILKNIEFVLIERDPEILNQFKNRYHLKPVLYVLGDATEDNILIDAGIKTASTIIPVLSDDAANLFTTMSAKFLNPNIKIVTRVNNSQNYNKLKKAGADSILSPHEITADRLFTLATEDNMITFMDILENYKNSKDLTLARINVKKESELIGKTLLESQIPKRTGLIIIGICRGDELLLNPSPSMKILHNDKLLVMGKISQVKKLELLA